MNTELNINEIFYSLQGEAREVGLPTVFVRLTGCPLRCSYCDTEYAFKGNNTASKTGENSTSAGVGCLLKSATLQSKSAFEPMTNFN
jgi:organic radical activating enzyme